MNDLTILYYFLYLGASALLVFFVGRQLYREGQVYIDLLFKNAHQAKALNRLLLLAYYLLNLGYVAYRLAIATTLSSYLELGESLLVNLGLIGLLLGVLHLNNLILLFLLSKSKFNLKTV